MDPSIARWIAVLDKVTHYELLGVQPDAGADALRHAYQGFAATFHPDAHMHRSREERASVNTIFKRGTEAYRVLSDPALRARYDDDQAGRSGGASAGSGAMPAAARASSTFPGARKTEAPKPGLRLEHRGPARGLRPAGARAPVRAAGRGAREEGGARQGEAATQAGHQHGPGQRGARFLHGGCSTC